MAWQKDRPISSGLLGFCLGPVHVNFFLYKEDIIVRKLCTPLLLKCSMDLLYYGGVQMGPIRLLW